MNQVSLRLRDKPFWSFGRAVTNEYMLDKEQTWYNDLLDGFRFSLIFYEWSKDWRMITKTLLQSVLMILLHLILPSSKLFCKLCNCNLTLLDPQKGRMVLQSM
jgi:hypothetical protein